MKLVNLGRSGKIINPLAIVEVKHIYTDLYWTGFDIALVTGKTLRVGCAGDNNVEEQREKIIESINEALK